MRKHSLRPSAGFTLVELLVVITIIIVLAALSFMGFSRIRESSETALAISNMRQLQVANVSYSTDHNGRYMTYLYVDPDGGKTYWYRDLEFLAYLTGNQELAGKNPSDVNMNTVVPQNLLDPTVVRAKKRAYTSLSASFGVSYEFMKIQTNEDGSQERFVRASQLTNPSRTAAFVSATDSAAAYASRKLWWSSPVEGKTTNGKMAFRHGDKAVVAYYDGSTGTITKQDIDRFDANGGKNNPFWKGN